MSWVLLALFTAARAWDARPGIRGDPLQRVERELNASLHAYPRITTQQRAERLLLRILSDPKRSALILGHRLLVDNCGLAQHHRPQSQAQCGSTSGGSVWANARRFVR